jgi:AGZA family xanthine/uracil permease-like MFS transporter
MRQGWWVRGDLDGFFGLMVDNLVQILIIVALTRELLHFPDALVFGRILPGVAVSLLVGNLYYGWQARQLAARTGRTDVTALPFGINTPSVFAYVLLVMLPVWLMGEDLPPDERATRAWQAGLAACFFSGVIEALGALVGARLRRYTPRAALLAALSGIALTFISMDFMLRIFRYPLVGLLGFGFVLAHYMGRRPLPFGVPAGLLAVVIGSALAFWLKTPQPPSLEVPWGLALPWPVLPDLLRGLSLPSLDGAWSVIISMGLLNVLGTLQNIESAQAAGDSYPVAPTMLVNGLATLAAAGFGSCFPTTVYIGHPGWKAMGARTGYSIANGVFWLLVICGGLAPVLVRYVPVEAGAGIVVWIAIVITAQAFQATPRRHGPAIALGLFPALAAWGVISITGALRASGVVPDAAHLALIDASGAFAMSGALHLWSGFLFTSTVWAAMACALIDNQFRLAAGWAGVAAALSACGVMHGYRLTAAGPVESFGWGAAGLAIPVCYALLALLFAGQGRARRVANAHG